jgi:hypothetical protein
MRGAKQGGTLKHRDNLAPTKELARLNRQVKRLKSQEFEPPSAKNNFSSPGLAARKALQNISPGAARLNRLQKDNDYLARMAISKGNRSFETQRKVRTGEFSGKRTAFRSPKAAAGRYSSKIQSILAGSKTYGQNKHSHGLTRKTIGSQFNLLGSSTPIKTTKRTASNFNPDSYKVARRRGSISRSPRR